jgi:methylthioribose-1-phosphate isomerase
MWGTTDLYGIGMHSGQGHGSLSDYAMTFQMDNTNNRGFVWRDSAMSANQGAMSLTTDGRANIAYGLRLGYGQSDTAANNSTYRLQVSGQIYGTSNITAYSDERAKENIVDIDSALDKVLEMRGVYYNMRETHSQNDEHLKRRVGVIAQEMEPILPEVVTYEPEEDIYSVDYGNITGILIEAIKDQQKQIKELKDTISNIVGDKD